MKWRTGTLGEVDEAALVRRIARGDQAAFDELYRRTSPWLTTRLQRRCADEDVVADVLQETYLAVWRASSSFTGARTDGGAVGWLWTIAAHRLVDAFRQRARNADVPSVDALAGTAPAAEDEALSTVVGGEMSVALRQLAPELQQVLQATVLDGLTVRETAILLGLPEGTVKTRARRARVALKGALSS